MEEQKPKRGCFLTGILWVSIVFSVLQFVNYILARFVIKVFDSSNPLDSVALIKGMSVGMFTYYLITIILGLIAYILILCWKKQGCYLLVAISAIGFIVSFITVPVVDIIVIGTAIIGLLISLAIAYFSYKAIEKREKFMIEES